jgi:hypothetical protein
VSHSLPAIRGDFDDLLSDAPRAIDSFYPGHWNLMARLERKAKTVLADDSIVKWADFLANVAFLKQPYRVDQQVVQEQVARYPDKLRSAIFALRCVRELDYQAMEALAQVPWFGLGGGRAFNSAVMRLVRPESFGIIDWRNLAVIMGVKGFDGLIDPAVRFAALSSEEVLEKKGHLTLTQSVYQKYNDGLRELARRYSRKVSEIDLTIWTYSIRRQPFRSDRTSHGTHAFIVKDSDRRMLLQDHKQFAERLVQDYLTGLRDLGYLSRQRVADALRDVFSLIRNECELFGRDKRGRLREKVKQVVTALDQVIARSEPGRFQAVWNRWHGMVDPASPNWIGISLPTEMVLEGYLVFEDFLPVKEYFESHYDSASLDPLCASE